MLHEIVTLKTFIFDYFWGVFDPLFANELPVYRGSGCCTMTSIWRLRYKSPDTSYIGTGCTGGGKLGHPCAETSSKLS